MKKKKKLLLFGGLGIVLVAIVVMNLTMSSENAVSVQIGEADSREIVEVVSASGRIQPQSKVNITSEINGEIIDLWVKEGDRVNVGDLLVVLDTVRWRSDVDQARYAVNEINARLAGAKTTLDQTREEHERQQRLFENDLTSETIFSNAKYAYMNAKSTYEAATAQAKQFQARYEQQLDYLSKAKIVAPMSGIITYLDCEVGEIAAAQTAYTQGRTLMTIADLNIFEVEVEVDETEINKVVLSQECEIEVDAFPDTVFAGEVVEIGNTAILAGMGTEDQSTNFRVKVIFKDRDVLIRPGMSATVDITTEKQGDALAILYSSVVMRSLDLDSLERAREMEDVETESVGVGVANAAEVGDVESDSVTKDVEREDVKGVFVVRDGKARFVQVETGIADQKHIEVTSGLNVGDTVISGPYRVLRTIKDGDPVEAEFKSDDYGESN